MANEFIVGFKEFLLNPNYISRKWLFNFLNKNFTHLKWILLDFWCGEKPYKYLINVDKYIWVDIKVSWHDNSQNEVDVFWDWKTLPFESGYFDSILSTEVFEHTFNLEEILKELNRVLKLNWKILITVPFVFPEHEIPYDFGRYTKYWLKYLLEENWFEIIISQPTTNDAQTLYQLIRIYLSYNINKYNFIIKNLFKIFIILPFTLIWFLLILIMPKSYNLYLNTWILAKKLRNV